MGTAGIEPGAIVGFASSDARRVPYGVSIGASAASVSFVHFVTPPSAAAAPAGGTSQSRTTEPPRRRRKMSSDATSSGESASGAPITIASNFESGAVSFSVAGAPGVSVATPVDVDVRLVTEKRESDSTARRTNVDIHDGRRSKTSTVQGRSSTRTSVSACATRVASPSMVAVTRIGTMPVADGASVSGTAIVSSSDATGRVALSTVTPLAASVIAIDRPCACHTRTLTSIGTRARTCPRTGPSSVTIRTSGPAGVTANAGIVIVSANAGTSRPATTAAAVSGVTTRSTRYCFLSAVTMRSATPCASALATTAMGGVTAWAAVHAGSTTPAMMIAMAPMRHAPAIIGRLAGAARRPARRRGPEAPAAARAGLPPFAHEARTRPPRRSDRAVVATRPAAP